jgi:hypothetical protein
MNKNCLIVLAILTLACVRPRPVTWTHPAEPSRSFQADQYECEVKARQILRDKYPTSELARAMDLNKEIGRCLGALGWVPQA